MKSDDWFYRLLKSLPRAFFELQGLPASHADRYRFDSVELKSSGYRIDGVFLPLDEADPVHFVEVQGYQTPTFYANFFTKVFAYLEQNRPSQDWRGVAIFVKRGHEPKETASYRMLLESPNFRRIYLDELPAEEDPPLGLGLWQLVNAA